MVGSGLKNRKLCMFRVYLPITRDRRRQVISFEDFNKRILREDQHHTTSYSFDKLQQSIEEVYLLDTPHGKYGFAVKYAFRKLMGKETPKYTE